MIISLRGTNGSGKTTVVRNLLDTCLEGHGLYSEAGQARIRLIYRSTGVRLPEAYELKVRKVDRPLYVIGSYLTPTGGCDRLPNYDMALELIEMYSARGHVLFEGVLISSNFGRIGELLERFGKDAVMMTLDTSLEECIRRVNSRRGTAKGRLNPRQLTAKYRSTQLVAEKARKRGIIQVVEANSEHAHTDIIQLLRST